MRWTGSVQSLFAFVTLNSISFSNGLQLFPTHPTSPKGRSQSSDRAGCCLWRTSISLPRVMLRFWSVKSSVHSCKGKDELRIQTRFCVFPALCFIWENKAKKKSHSHSGYFPPKTKQNKDIFDRNKLLTDATVLLGQYYKIAGKCFFLYLNIVEKISYNCYKAGHSLLFFF